MYNAEHFGLFGNGSNDIKQWWNFNNIKGRDMINHVMFRSTYLASGVVRYCDIPFYINPGLT